MIEDFNKTFIDTAPFVYILEFNKQFTNITKNKFKEMGSTQFVTSVISYAEFCVKPKRINNLDAILKFKKFTQSINCEMKNINLAISEITAELRAKYLFLRTPDALQLATAIHHSCSKFLTNDKKLKKINEIEVVLISD